MTTTIIIATIVNYLAGMIYIGVAFGKKSKNTDDFYLGGRKMGPIVTAMSAEASDMSSWLLMGIPGLAYLTGICDPFWTIVGLGVGTYLNWLIVAKRIRRYTAVTKANTVPDFFDHRFGDKTGILMALSALIIVFFFVPYTASGFSAVAKLFNSLFGVDYHLALIGGAIVITIYTVIGGFMAVSFTDLIQSILMTIALFVVVLFALNYAGGADVVMENATNITGYFAVNATHNVWTGATGDYNFVTILSTCAWGLGYFGMPHILLRFMAIENEDKLRVSRRIGTIWVFISMFVALFIGVTGYSFINALSADTGSTVQELLSNDSERLIVVIANTLAQKNWFFAIIGGLILSGILASTMSTADSQLLAASSSVSENIVRRFFAKNMSSSTAMWVARITTIVISFIGVFFAWDVNSSVFGIVSFAWAGFGAAFGPIVLLALFWRRMNQWGALAGMLAGGVGVVVWEYVITPYGIANGIQILTVYELLPAFILAVVATVVVSLLTPAPEKSVIDTFDKVKKSLKNH